jgi:alkanesulfonate monooxygenase SsuD/methylene tetrahydromethanopterin reductase-like flavin-dependent oxidoreductase (luciferase family)
MKFGLFYLPTYLPTVRDVQTHYRGIIEQVEFADRIGIDYVWLVEHHCRVAAISRRMVQRLCPVCPNRHGYPAMRRKYVMCDDGIWLASFMHYDLGYFDLEQKTLQPLDNPFGPGLSPMS